MEPMFDLDLTGEPAADGGLFPLGAAIASPDAPALGRSGQLVWFRHPDAGDTVVGTMFGPGPREGTVAVTYRGALLLIDTTYWTITH